MSEYLFLHHQSQKKHRHDRSNEDVKNMVITSDDNPAPRIPRCHDSLVDQMPCNPHHPFIVLFCPPFIVVYTLQQIPLEIKNPDKSLKSNGSLHITSLYSQGPRKTPYSKQGVFVEAADPNVVHEMVGGIK